MSRPVTWVNGAAQPTVSTCDRGLHFGDGVFETIACEGHRARFLSLHLQRLLDGCARLGIRCGPAAPIRAEIQTVAAEAGRAILKVLVTRGTADARGYTPSGTEDATRITLRYPWPAQSANATGEALAVRTLALRLGENPQLAGLKHCNRLEQVLARAECADRKLAEGILFSSSGHLVSGTFSNVFLVRDSQLLTPRIDRCGVAGVMRRVIMREARRAGIDVEECELAAAQLQAAQEVFLTNALSGIRPVHLLDGRELGAGPLTRRLQALIAPLLEQPSDE
ncbi:MAG TPA: aminodeoxychorismate lyase [Steroidobacteraceae bacterium]